MYALVWVGAGEGAGTHDELLPEQVNWGGRLRPNRDRVPPQSEPADGALAPQRRAGLFRQSGMGFESTEARSKSTGDSGGPTWAPSLTWMGFAARTGPPEDNDVTQVETLFALNDGLRYVFRIPSLVRTRCSPTLLRSAYLLGGHVDDNTEGVGELINGEVLTSAQAQNPSQHSLEVACLLDL